MIEENMSPVLKNHSNALFMIAAIALAIIAVSCIAISDCPGTSAECSPGDTFESTTAEGVTLTYMISSLNDLSVFVGDGSSIDIGDATAVTIPSTVNYDDRTFSVRGINNYAFYYDSTLTSVSLPSSLIYIYTYAFEGTQLSSISLPSDLVYILKGAFAGTCITSLDIPDSVRYIGVESFAWCFDLTTVKLGTSISYIGNGAFINSAVTSFSVSADNTKYSSSDGILLNKAGTEIVLYPTGLTAPYTTGTGITSLANYSFYCCALTGITISATVTSIGDHAFDSCYELTSVIINSTSTTIGEYSFAGTGITSIDIGSNVSTIGNYAFYCCDSLQSVSINNTNSSGVYRFMNCTALTSISIGANPIYIDGRDFIGCTSVTSVTVDPGNKCCYAEDNVLYWTNGTTKQLKYYPAGLTGSFTIPSDVDDITSYAFAYSNMTSIDIPDNVTSVFDHVFYGCKELTAVTLGSELDTISYNTFEECSSLISITIPESITSIGSSAFKYCTSLEHVYGCSGLKSLGASAFCGCTSLQSISLTNKSLIISSYSDENGTFEKCTSLTSITLPSTLTEIGYNMFYYCPNLKSIDIPLTVTAIKSGAFGESGLTSISLPAGLLTIEDYAFYGCYDLASVTGLDTVTSIGECAFYRCESLTSITLGNYLESIGAYAFFQTKFTSVSIPDNVTTIGEGCFKYCRNLTAVDIGRGVTSLGGEAFSGCKSLSTINFNATECKSVPYNNFENCGTIGNGISVVFGDNVLSIPNKLFAVNQTLTIEHYPNIISVTFGSSIENIGDYAFYKCLHTSEITLPDSVTTIGVQAFYENRLTSLTIGSGVTSIGKECFYNSQYLQTLVFNAASCEHVKKDTFYRLGISGSGTTVTFGSTVSYIPSYLFATSSTDAGDMPFVKSVSMANVKTIGEYAFKDCRSLTSITIPESVTRINDLAFDGCKNLTYIYFNAKQCTLYDDTYPFSDCGTETSGITVTFGKGVSYVPAGLFQSAPDNITNIKTVFLNDVKQILSKSFYGTPLTSIELNDMITHIGAAAFGNCTQLTSVYIGKNVINIGAEAFMGCTSLSTVEFNAIYCQNLTGSDIFADTSPSLDVSFGTDVYCIPANLFRSSTALPLNTIVIPDNVYTIKSDAFITCTNLTSLTIGSGVVNLGSLNGLTSLTNLNFNAKYCSNLTHDANIFSDVGTESVGVTVVFGKDVTYVPANMFYVDSNGTAPKIASCSFTGNSVVTIGAYAFSGTSTVNADIPDGVKFINEGAFCNCGMLTSVTIPSTVSSIDGTAFSSCPSLTEYTVDENNKYYCSENGVLFNKIDKILMSYPTAKPYTEYKIPSGTLTLAYEAFCNCSKLERLIIPDTVSSTSNGAVQGCTSIKYIEISKNIVSLSDDDFTDLTFYDIDGTQITDKTELIGCIFSGNTGNELKKQVIISFDPDGGSAVDPIIGEADSPVSAPEPPTKEGYRFTKWQLNGSDYEFTVMPAVNITLKAVWGPNEYIMTYHCPDETSTKIHSTTKIVIPNSPYGELSVPARTGYTFDGWYLEDTFVTKITEDTVFSMICDHTIHAKWSPICYMITFSGNDSTGGSMENQILIYDAEQKLTPNSFSKTGHTFLGWSKNGLKPVEFTDEQSISNLTTLMNDTINLYAVWSVNQYTLSFDTCGGTEIQSVTQDYGTDITMPAAPTRTGYTFSYWTPEIPSVMPAMDTECTAIWTPNTYTVTFDPRDGTASFLSKNVTFDSTYGELPTCERIGHTFGGWYTVPVKGDRISSESTVSISADHTLYAVWTINVYDVRYYVGEDNVFTEEHSYGSTVQVRERYETEGYTVSDWDRSGTFVMPAEDVVITATKTVNQYKVTFINCGNVYQTYTADYGSLIERPSDDPTKEPTVDVVFRFAGWEGYTEGMTVPAEDSEFTAVYDAFLREYTVTFTNLGEVVMKVNVGYGRTIPVPSDPVRPSDSNFDYTFTGWDGYKKGATACEDVTYDATYLASVRNITVSDGKIVIPSSNESKVVLDASKIADIKSKVNSGDVSELVIELSEGKIVLDPEAIKSLKDDSSTVSIRTIQDRSALPEDVAKKLEGRTVYAIDFGSNHEFGGELTITVNYQLKDGEKAEDLEISYYSDSGECEKHACTYADGKATFTSDHLSCYAVTLKENTAASGSDSTMLYVGIGAAVVVILGLIVFFFVRKK